MTVVDATRIGREMTALEVEHRARLGVPADAPRVVVVTESTHWDPDWLLTSTEYLRTMVRGTLDRAIDALEAEPRRIYSLECTFFPDLYWTASPERRSRFHDLVEQGRLRFTGCGVTTPDTLIPEDELLLRDLLEGQEWMRARGMTQEPRVLYLPDSFGHSPGLPALLAAADVPYAAICRIDGMRFPGAELEAASHFPIPGSTAAQLTAAGTADFIWRGPDGTEVLTHWHAFGYGHGDMVASGGFSRALGLPLSWPSRDARKVASRIDGIIDQLTPLARTPYLLLAIGFDFVRPVPRLVELLDRWNETEYDRTGVWLVNAGLDDYLDLVAEHRDALPTFEADPNPYWTGFYSSRPALKRACRDLGRTLIAADHVRTVATLRGGGGARTTPTDRTTPTPWWVATTSNHHDFVTGTAPNRVARAEQWPWLTAALREARAAAGTDATPVDGSPTCADDAPATPAATWTRDGGRVTVTCGAIEATFDEAQGGALVRLVDGERVLVDRPSLVLTAHAESGGLWRMGNEYPGGRWTVADASDRHPALVTVLRTDAGARVAVRSTLDGRPAATTLDLSADGSEVVVRTAVAPRLRRTVTLGWAPVAEPTGLQMHQPGGIVARPLHRRFTPTFWPLHSWAALTGDPALPSLVVATSVPTALHVSETLLECVVARNAPKELAYGVVPLLAPAIGLERGTHRAELAFGSSPVDLTAQIATGRTLWEQVDRAAGRRRPEWVVEVDDELVEIIAVKPADRGPGTIVRLRSWMLRGARKTIRLTAAPSAGATIGSAWRTDARERDLEPLAVSDGIVTLDLATTFTTVRVTFATPDPITSAPASDGRG